VSGNAAMQSARQAIPPGGLFHLLGFEWNLFASAFVSSNSTTTLTEPFKESGSLGIPVRGEVCGGGGTLKYILGGRDICALI
jgi:hypothetical protein